MNVPALRGVGDVYLHSELKDRLLGSTDEKSGGWIAGVSIGSRGAN
jgi:hypothetical protein